MDSRRRTQRHFACRLVLTAFLVLISVLGVSSGAEGSFEGQFLYIGADRGYVARVAPDGTLSRYAEVEGATRGLAMDEDGTLWVATSRGHLFRVEPGPEGKTATIANGAVTRFAEGIRSPLGMDIDPNGDFWIAEHYDGVVKVERATGKKDYINVEGGAYSVERGPNGHMYVSRQNGNTVYEFLPDGTPVRGTVADPEPLIAGYGNGHRSICFTPEGDILLIWRKEISRFSADGQCLGTVFDWEKADGFDRARFIKNGMKHPVDLAVDARGNLYGSDRAYASAGKLIVGGTVFRYKEDGTRELFVEIQGGVNWMTFWPPADKVSRAQEKKS